MPEAVEIRKERNQLDDELFHVSMPATQNTEQQNNSDNRATRHGQCETVSGFLSYIQCNKYRSYQIIVVIYVTRNIFSLNILYLCDIS